MSQNIRRYLEKVSDNMYVMHFCHFQPENCDAKCILSTTGNWFDCESCKTCFINNNSNLFMTGP